jgi:hypothetical protein
LGVASWNWHTALFGCLTYACALSILEIGILRLSFCSSVSEDKEFVFEDVFDVHGSITEADKADEETLTCG